jgi:hypothetical protein
MCSNAEGFLNSFAKLRKVTISFVMSVRPSVHSRRTTGLPLNSSSWNFIFEYFSKTCRHSSSIIKIWQERRVLDTKTNIDFISYLAQFSVEWETFQVKVLEKIKAHILYSIIFPFENRAVYEIMWKNIVQSDRPQVAIWRMRIAYWITKASDTLRECNTYCFCTATVVKRMRLYVTFILHCLSCTLVWVLCKKCLTFPSTNQMETCPLLRLTKRKKRERD